MTWSWLGSHAVVIWRSGTNSDLKDVDLAETAGSRWRGVWPAPVPLRSTVVTPTPTVEACRRFVTRSHLRQALNPTEAL